MLYPAKASSYAGATRFRFRVRVYGLGFSDGCFGKLAAIITKQFAMAPNPHDIGTFPAARATSVA